MARRRTRSIFRTAHTERVADRTVTDDLGTVDFNDEGGVDTGWGDFTYLVTNPDDFAKGPTMEEWLDSLPADEKMTLPTSWLDAQASRAAELGQRETAILQAMGKATLPEQRQLLAELNAIRTERTALHQAARSVDLANATIRDHLTPVASLGARSSAKSDWLAEVPTYNPGDLTHTMVAEATLFYRGLHPMVKADAEELVIQSLGKARQVAAQFEGRATIAARAFMDEIVRLAEAQPAAEPAEDGAAESSLPVAINPSDAPETFDEDTLAISDSQMADSDFAQKYQSSRSTAAVLAAMNDTLWARLGSDPDDERDADEEAWQAANDDTKDDAEDTGGDTEEEDDDDDDSPFPKESARKTAARPLSEIARDIRRDWKNVYFGAEPYLDAMAQLNSIDDDYYQDPASHIVNYFLSNASGWRGETAKAIKAELKAMLGRKASKSAARRTAVSLTNVGLDGENGIGTDPQGNRVRFKLSPQDRKDLASVLFSDMAVNFTGVDVDESDIIRSASRRTASVVDTLRQIVEQKQYQSVNGQIIDLFSASLILGVLDALNPENQAKFTKIIEANPAQAAEVAAKLTNKSASKTAADRDPNERYSDWPGGDGACSKCFVGIPHTKAEHDSAAEYGRSKGLGNDNPPQGTYSSRRRTAADEPSDTGAAESSLPVAVNPSDAPEGLDQLTDGSGDAPSGAAAGSPTTFADFVADRSKLSAFRQRVQAAKTAMPNPVDLGVKVGDIFVSSWGYDQTNVDFYEVVGLTGASVKVRKVAKRYVAQNGPGGNKVMPQPGNYIGEVMTKRIQGGESGWSKPSFNVSSYATAFLWDGTPEYETDSMFGR